MPKKLKYDLRALRIFRTLRPLNAFFATMFAIVEIAGFQEKVKEGDTLDVPLQDSEKGKKITFGNVLMLSKGEGDLSIGAPYVSGASVEVKVIEHGRGDKVRVYRMRRRKRFQKARGHRQDFTTIEVVKIAVA